MTLFQLPTALPTTPPNTLVSSFTLSGGMTVYMAGQNITNYVRESTIKVSDALGQGAGTGAGVSGRATTCEFLTSLGPVNAAKGAGQQLVGGPYLVRQGEVRIYDINANLIFGGFASSYKDATVRTKVYTDVSCHDYWQHTDTIIVNETYDGQTDIAMIAALCTKYAPWIDLSQLPTIPGYTFGPRVFQHYTLMKALQNIVDTSGYQLWITPDKKLHYVLPTGAPNAPFALSDTPNNSTSFKFQTTAFETDDNAAINRVYFFGGKHLSGDITYDLSVQCNGAAKVFVLPYYPHKASDGKFHIIKNGVQQTFGFSGGTGAANTLTTDGGTANLLLNIDAHTIESDTAFPGGTTLQATFRREIPLVVVLPHQASYSFFGTYLDGVVVDTAVFDVQTALQRCRVVLLEHAYGLTTMTVRCWKSGLIAGSLLHIKDTVRGVNGTYVIQQIDTIPLGGGNFAYDVSVGAWNWNLVDVVLQLAHAATPVDSSASEDNTPIQVAPLSEAVTTSDSVTTLTRGGSGSYLWRNAAVGDGLDIKWGLWQW